MIKYAYRNCSAQSKWYQVVYEYSMTWFVCGQNLVWPSSCCSGCLFGVGCAVRVYPRRNKAILVNGSITKTEGGVLVTEVSLVAWESFKASFDNTSEVQRCSDPLTSCQAVKLQVNRIRAGLHEGKSNLGSF